MSKYSAIYLKKFGAAIPSSDAPCNECGAPWIDHSFDVCPKVIPAKPGESACDLTGSEPSLTGSAMIYRRGHIRVSDQGLRLQGRTLMGHWEDSSHKVSTKLREYIGGLSHPCLSVAGTPTKYAQCLLRREGLKSVRVQIAGPALNRPWGAEFVLSNLPSAPGKLGPVPTSPTSAPVADHGYAVGDKIVIIHRGDGCGPDHLTGGCTGGPSVGQTGTVINIGAKGECGAIQLKMLGAYSKWTCTPAHIAHQTQVSPA